VSATNSSNIALKETVLRDDAWQDWKWQFRNRITTVGQLETVLRLSEAEKRDIADCLNIFRMAITPYYASLMDPDDLACPIRLQAVPTLYETRALPCDLSDPLCEERDSPVKNIVHRYPDRVLFLVTHQCAMYCRHCTRRRTVGEEDRFITRSEIDEAVSYITSTSAVRDVLISGGDPLTCRTLCWSILSPSFGLLITWRSSGSAPACPLCCRCASRRS
jgi:lysine 2,3-aminomutase